MADTTDYLDDLVLELRLLEVSGTRIGHILAEAESHLAESGETPEEAFGPVGAYARELALAEGQPLPKVPESRSALALVFGGMTTANWVVLVLSFVLTAVGMSALLNGVLAWFFDVDPWFGLPVWLLVVVGAAMIAAFLGYVRQLADPVIDPRSGRQVDFDRSGHRKPSS